MVAAHSYSIAVTDEAFASTTAQILVVLALGLVLESNYLFRIALGHWRQRKGFYLKLDDLVGRAEEVQREMDAYERIVKNLSETELHAQEHRTRAERHQHAGAPGVLAKSSPGCRY